MIVADTDLQALRRAAERLRSEAARLDAEADAMAAVRAGETNLLADLVPIALVARHRGISKEAARKWAHRQGLARRVDGKLYLSASDL